MSRTLPVATTEAVGVETRQVFDPFEGKTVDISSNLIDRLEGRYAIGPTMPNGEPEFGWRQHQTLPICHEAAQRIRAMQATHDDLAAHLQRAVDHIEHMADWISNLDRNKGCYSFEALGEDMPCIRTALARSKAQRG